MDDLLIPTSNFLGKRANSCQDFRLKLGAHRHVLGSELPF